ncbi:MAG: hypothetical protein ACRD2Z_07310 [Thermoanaerobaculia bacterium]
MSRPGSSPRTSHRPQPALRAAPLRGGRPTGTCQSLSLPAASAGRLGAAGGVQQEAGVDVTLDIRVDLPDDLPDTLVRTITENCRTLGFKTFEIEKE